MTKADLPEEVSAMKQCPHCAELVKSDGIACPHCGHRFAAIAPLDQSDARPTPTLYKLGCAAVVLFGLAVFAWWISATGS